MTRKVIDRLDTSDGYEVYWFRDEDNNTNVQPEDLYYYDYNLESELEDATDIVIVENHSEIEVPNRLRLNPTVYKLVATNSDGVKTTIVDFSLEEDEVYEEFETYCEEMDE